MAVVDQLTVKLTADTSNFDRNLGQSQQSFSGFSSVIGGMAAGVGMAAVGMAAAGGAALIQFGADGIGMASDLGETLSKVNVVFGENAAAVQAWGENAATALGQSKSEALGAAATFGNLFVSMGMTTDSSSDMSMNLVELATDLASFNNMSTTEALDKLKAGMLGQSEPMQSLGVNMTAAMVSAKGLEMGLAATTEELTPAMLAQARYALILEQTTTAQGDFSRTSDGLANQQRIADAQWKELQTTIGAGFLPVMTAVTTAMNQLVQQVLPPISDFINTQITPAMQSMSDAFSRDVAPAIALVQGWFGSLGTTMQAQADGPMAYLRNWFDTNMPRIQEIVDKVVGAITAFWTEHGETIMASLQIYGDWLMRFWDTIMRTVLDVVTVILQLMNGEWEEAGATLQGILERMRVFVVDAFSAMGTGIRDWFTSVDWGGIGLGIIQGIANGVRNAASFLTQAAQDAAWAAFEAAKNALGIHSPSSVTEKGIGVPFIEGIGEGMRSEMARLQASVGLNMDSLVGGFGGGAAAAGGGAGAGGINIVINVTGSGGEDTGMAVRDGVLSALRSAGLR